MSYIGKEPINGNFSVADAITTSSTATSALTVGSVAFTPESVNHCIVSLNGVIQAPTSAFTISGTNIVFNSALTSADVIDFIYFLGHVNDIGTPSDNTVSQAKLVNESVNEAKMQISNAGSNGQFLSKQSGNTGGLTWAAAGGDISFGGDTFGANKVIGANDAYSLSLETSGNTALTIDANGHITMPKQVAFHAESNTDLSNCTGDGSDVKLTYQTEHFDQNGDFSSQTFTAPITGRYLFTWTTAIYGIGAGHDMTSWFETSNNNYLNQINLANVERNNEYYDCNSVIADMDASDTATVNITVGGGSKTIDTNAIYQYFSGVLLC